MTTKRRSWSVAVALMVSAATVLSACSKSTETKTNNPAPAPAPGADPNAVVDGGTLTIGTFSGISTLNQIHTNDTASGDVSLFLFASLYDYNRDFDLEVNERTIAAELPKVSADGKTYTIKLKPNATWSDGAKITAEDVVFTYKTIATKETGSPGYSTYEGVEEFKVVDPTTVEIKLKDVDARFWFGTNVTPVPAKAFAGVKPEEIKDFKFGKTPADTITSGPYIWKESVEGSHQLMERRADYWGKKPNIQTVIIKQYADQNTEVQALLNGEIDFISTVPVATLPAVTGKPGIKVFESKGQSYDYLSFQFNPVAWGGKESPFTGKKTRQAIGHAINKKGMIDSVLQGHGTSLESAFMGWAADANYKGFEYNVELAKKLLAEDGWKPGADGILEKNGQKFEFDLMTNSGNKRRESYAAVVQANLKDVGIKVNLKPLDFQVIVNEHTEKGTYQALILGWSLSSPDPDSESVFSSKFYPPAGQNSGWYKNEKIDQLWVDGYRTADPAKRKGIYGQITKEMHEDPPYIFLAVMNVMTTYSDRVHWKEADRPQHSVSYGYLYHVMDWWVTPKK